MKWKNFLYFQKGEKIAVILLLILIVLVLVMNLLLSQRYSREIILVQNDSIVKEFQEFQKSLRMKETKERESQQYRQPYYDRNKRQDYQYSKTDSANYTRNYTPFPRQEKLEVGETIFLNSTDTAEWKKIPGIGSSYAERIVKYRNLLGGFASTEQLREVYGIDNEMFSRIAPYIAPDANFRKIHINKLEFKELLSHPYLNYKQVQAINNLRKRKGKVASLNELAMLEEFTTEDIERLRPYLEF